MRIRAAYDRDGRILTAIPVDDENSEPTVHMGEKLGADIAEFTVPSEFEGKKFHEFVHLLRVETVSMRLVIKDH